jgi:hypothetical protein
MKRKEYQIQMQIFISWNAKDIDSSMDHTWTLTFVCFYSMQRKIQKRICMFFSNNPISICIVGVWLPKCKESGETCRVRFNHHLDRSGVGELDAKQHRIAQSLRASMDD